MDKQSHYIQAIQDVYPNLSIETVELKQHGQFNDILVVNQEALNGLEDGDQEAFENGIAQYR